MKDLLKQIDSADGEFHNGDPSTGEQGTRVTDTWLNDVQAHLIDFGIELKYLLAKAELTPDPNKKTQIYDAINKIISDSKITLTSELTNNSASIGASAHAAKKLKDLIDALTRNLGNYIPNSKKSDHIDSYSSDMVATSKAVRTLYDWCYQQLQQKSAINHQHDASEINNLQQTFLALFTQSLTDNGWQKLPNGLILQWGILSPKYEYTDDYDFNIAFPAKCFGVIGTYMLDHIPAMNKIGAHRWGEYGAGSAVMLFMSPISTSKFRVYSDDNFTHPKLFWISLGC